jgi:hypothetical protein
MFFINEIQFSSIFHAVALMIYGFEYIIQKYIYCNGFIII